MNNPRYRETEIKLYVPDLEAVALGLTELGAELRAPRVFERNVRYENAEKTLTDAKIVVRLRQDTCVRLTYKEPPQLIDGNIPSRFEAEVEVGDFGTMDLILGKLGYFPHQVYEKYRTTYELDGAEIVLDEMPYGNFVEIEGEPGAIRTVVEKLKLQNATRLEDNYLELFENVRRNLNLSFTDLTFTNFYGINVPQSAFDN
jgi:adenylate cyclase, class 2